MNDLSGYAPYSDAYSRLDRRLQTTPHEMAQWISVAKNGGGLNAYKINRFRKPILFKYQIHRFYNNRSDDFISPLRKLYFLNDDIEQFQPATRYISRPDWIKRLADIYGDESHALKKLIEDGKSPLFEYHPIAGGVEPEGELFSSGVFDLDDVRKIESLYFPASLLANAKDGATKKTKKKRKDTFSQRLDALKKWLIGLDYLPGDELIKLPKQYTLEFVYTELGKEYPHLFATIEMSSFDSHFWGKQKIVELMRGNKSAIL